MNTEFPQLKIERLECGLIRLEDTASLGGHTLDVHPLQVRHMAESLGLVRQMSASEADTLAAARRQHTDALRVVLTLKRRMLVLKDRIDHLGKSLVMLSDREEIDYELTHLTATAEICDEFCADLDDLVKVAGDDAGATPVAPTVSRVTNALAPGAAGTTATSENPTETQRVTSKALAVGQQKDLLA